MKLLIASAMKIPLIPINFGKITVNGATMMTFLKIEKKNVTENKSTPKTSSKKENTKNNVVSLEKAKENMEKKKETAQISLFGGVV